MFVLNLAAKRYFIVSRVNNYLLLIVSKYLCGFLHFLLPGALNHQTAHHLFPSVSQIYYPAITPIVRETCKEFGVRYNYKDTLFQALGCHISHLKRLGQLPEKPSNLRQGS